MIASSTDRVPSALSQVERYLVSRQSRHGGFCFYRTEYLDEPNLSDTYHAVRTLTLLGRKIPRRMQLLRFLEAGPESHQTNVLYFQALTMRTLDPGFVGDEGLRRRIGMLQIPPAPGDHSGLSAWLERARMITRLKRPFAQWTEAKELSRDVVALQRDTGGFGSRPNLWDTWLALDLLRCCGEPVDLSATAGFLERLQTGPFGFSAVEGGLSATLDDVYAGLRCCAALGVTTRDRTAALSFILACQSGRGGFGRAPDSLPDIELSHRAVWAICHLTSEAMAPGAGDGAISAGSQTV